MENFVKEAIMDGAAFARENGCNFILALGGGAVLDPSKAIAAMAISAEGLKVSAVQNHYSLLHRSSERS